MDDINNRICHAIENHASKIALIGQGRSLTYLEMNEYIKQIMYDINLFCRGEIEGKLVYIYMHSSLEAIISQFAVIRSGAICVPLDRQTSLEYYALDNIGNVACMLTDDYKSDENIRFPIFQIKMLPDMVFEKSTYTNNNHPNFVARHSHCIMTSGTTGNPKAILLKQKAILNQIDAKIQLLKMSHNSKLCLSMGLSFVASIWQVYATIFVGGTLIVLNEQSRRSPYEIFKMADENHVSILCTVPSVLQAYLMIIKNKSRKLELRSMETILLTGELLYTVLSCQFYKEYNIPLLNAYGQTECSDDTFHYWVPRELNEKFSPVVPIGFPIENIDFAIVDEAGKRVAKNVRGELCIAGICLADGYLNDLERSKDAFRSLDALDGAAVFCTGDVVEQCEDNMIICYGRLDNQIKLHGYRIEPEAIEVSCLSFHGIRDVLVIKENTSTDAYLKLLYVTQDKIDNNNLREHLAQRLPHYMLPSVYEKINYIQYNEHGKKIRGGGERKMKTHNSISSKEDMLKIVEIIYKKNLGRPLEDFFTVDDNFLSLLNSIEFISLIVGLEETLEIEFDDEKLLFSAFPTLNDLIIYLLNKVKILSDLRGINND